MSIEVGELPVEHWNLLLSVPPYDTLGGLPDPNHTRVVVMIDTDIQKIVGYWHMFDAIHLEPLWIAEEYRHRPKAGIKLWNKILELLDRAHAKVAFAFIDDADIPKNLPLAKKLGFRQIPGACYWISTDEAKLAKIGQHSDKAW